ncbi:MAG: hypothetical protein A3F70_11230 [Acidobacteria bacterium RIFCSPLOWO2_12_FULL_67_14]|nr:MAG: hypothetical protein A3F70_11230 [Acidobacteria bacterium RIFCSPLOWO2_12_FULL_67_14]
MRPLLFVLALAAPAESLAQSDDARSPQDPPVASQAAPDNGGRRTMTAVRLPAGASVVLDGRLDEAFWQQAAPAADFIQIDPDNGTPATEPTEVRIVFDDDALYMGVTCFDSDPEGWIGFERRRDQTLGSDDRFMWTIDTFLDGRSGYFFEMNPSGLMADALMGTNGQNRQWDGIWNARVHRSGIGWTLEIEIPFRTLNFNPNSDTWGINFQRTVRRKNEDSIWMGWARNQGLRRMTNAGHVTGIREVSQGHGLDIKPYGLLSSQASPGRGRPAMDGSADAGVDLFYNPTPLLRANLTINTDFAQTEVDQRQVNLTRYSLFFPERRDFFLDGATFFDFGSDSAPQTGNPNAGRQERIIPFFSRRIGLTNRGEPQRIDFGTKITGQMGAQDVGVLHVRTGEDADADAASEDFTVVRLKRRLLQQSYIGAVWTRRDPRIAGGGTSQAAGIDAKLATSSFLGSENLEAGGWFLHTSRPGVSTGTSAFGATLDYPNDLWNLRADALEVQEHFDPAVGFITRQAYRQYTQLVDYGPRPRSHRYIRQFTFGGAGDIQTDLQNRLLTRYVELTPFQIQLHSQEMGGVVLMRRYERLDAPFEISRDITLPIGSEYTFDRIRLWGQTANRRMLAVNARYETGDFYSGTRSERNLTLNMRLRPGLILYLTGQWNSIKLPEGSFATRLYRVVGETQFTPFIALVNNIQYDSQSAVLGWQSRFRWIVTPGNDLYIVYTHNWLDDPLHNRLATLDKRIASKVLYTYRF